ncbi:MAG TPA: glyoxylate-induced protein [bacterium]|nr:glyoxylate-induced protein [bacterium]
MKLGVCLDSVFLDKPFTESVKEVKKIGYDGIEFWFHNYKFDGNDLIPEKRDIDGLKKALDETGLVCTDFVWTSADGAIDNASLINPEDFDRTMARLDEIIPIANKLNCKKFIACTGNAIKGKNIDEQKKSIIKGLKAAIPKIEPHGITVVLEPLNTHVDHAGYFLDTSDLCAEIVREINHSNIKLLYDIYHMQIMEGNIISHIERNLDIIGHFHSAGVPGRHELYIGELNYKYIVKKIEELGYDDTFGLEYFTAMEPAESLKKVFDYLLK